jgi:hypothetical protein
MKLIFVHGRSQENRTEAALKKEWRDALDIGLEKAGLVFPPNITVELPYYGQLLPELVNEENPRLTQIEGLRDSSGSISESEQFDFHKATLTQLMEGIELTKDERTELIAFIDNERGKEDYKAFHLFLALLDKIPVFRTSALNIVTKDVLMYVRNAKVKTAVNTLVEQCFDTDDCVVVGHSLGSIVSYLVLLHNPKFKVKKFITLGSPLGLSSVQDSLGQLRMPTCIDKGEKGGWFNAFDKRDIVSLFPLDKKHFNIQPPIENKSHVENFTDNRHGIEGYLSDVLIAKTIYKALVS